LFFDIEGLCSSVEVMGFVERMTKLGFCPGIMDYYSNVIRFLVKKRKGFDALGVLKVYGIKPEIVCYTMVLNGVIVAVRENEVGLSGS
jgi:hypothetical protein